MVTNSFHQLRSYLTFRCAVQQSLPKDRQVQASASSILQHQSSVILSQVNMGLECSEGGDYAEMTVSQDLADALFKSCCSGIQHIPALSAGLACTCAGGGSEPDGPQPSAGVQLLGLL